MSKSCCLMSRSKHWVYCVNCEKKFFPYLSSVGKYCSLACQKDYQYRGRLKEWFTGSVNPTNSNGLLTPWARRYIFEKNNNRCRICGWNQINEFTGKIPLEIDHIDGNYRNNNLSNLRLLCPNCHSLSSNYKALNKGRGRKLRKS